MKRRSLLATLPALALPAHAQTPAAEPGVSAREIVLGQTADLSASRSVITRAYSGGAQLHFDEVNRLGGIHGRQLRVVQLDDAYQTARALDNARQLVARPVFALVHSVGTAIAGGLIPYLETQGVPHVHPLTGGDEVRAPALPSRQTFFLRASYRREVSRIVTQLRTLGISRIALAHEDEPFGHGIRLQVDDAMQAAGLSLVATGLMPFNQPTAVQAAAQTVYRARPDAVIVGSAGPSVENFIAATHRLGLRTTYYCLSVSNVERLHKALGPLSEGVVVTQVMPSVRTSTMPVVRDYRRASAGPDSTPSGFGLEGFISARLITQALQAAGPLLTRARFIAMLEQPPSAQLGGFPVGHTPATRNGSPFVELAMIGRQGRLVQ